MCCSDADGWDYNLLSRDRPTDFVISLLLEDVGILGDQSLTRRCSEEGKLILYNLREKEEEETS